MAFKLTYIRSLTAKTIQNIQDWNMVRRAQNDLMLNRGSSVFFFDQSPPSESSPLHPQSTQLNSVRNNHQNSHKNQVNDDVDKPYQYSISRAAKFRAAENFRVLDNDIPPSQANVIRLSFLVALIYFAILREENDLDELIDQPLFKTLPHLEKPMLETALIVNERAGRSVEDIRKRLDDLEMKSTKN